MKLIKRNIYNRMADVLCENLSMNRQLVLRANGLFFVRYTVLTSPKKDETGVAGFFRAPIHLFNDKLIIK